MSELSGDKASLPYNEDLGAHSWQEGEKRGGGGGGAVLVYAGTGNNKCNISLVCYKSDIAQNALFFRRSFWKFNFLAITDEREIYLIISISKQCMESCKFPSTYTIISGLLDDVNNSEQLNFWFMSLL